MAAVEISYKGNTIASMDDSGTKTLLTSGSYCEDNITVSYTESGGGGGQLYIFTPSPYQHEYININNVPQVPRTSYGGQDIVEGATINFNTYKHWILDTITGETSGTSYPFTTISPTSYTFTMPGESVYCNLLYDD